MRSTRLLVALLLAVVALLAGVALGTLGATATTAIAVTAAFLGVLVLAVIVGGLLGRERPRTVYW